MRNADLIVGNISTCTPKTIDFGGAIHKLCNDVKFVPTWNFMVIQFIPRIGCWGLNLTVLCNCESFKRI